MAVLDGAGWSPYVGLYQYSSLIVRLTVALSVLARPLVAREDSVSVDVVFSTGPRFVLEFLYWKEQLYSLIVCKSALIGNT